MIKKEFYRREILFLIGILFFMSFLSAGYTRSDYGLANSYGTSSSSFFGSTSDFSTDVCKEGDDFILQIAPFGCTPAVVRSDLLEEQNVPVFCQIAATKVNPLINVKAIDSMTFSGEYPSEVSGVGFHPAKAALGGDSSLNSPVLNNIGYAVILLKKQENESAMPDFVEGNLTARISYNIENAFGIGKATFYLPQMTESEWELSKYQYGFWKNRAYLRAENIDEDSATISVYVDSKVISRVTLEKGETSSKIYIPGLDCLAGLQLRLDGLEPASTRVKLSIDGDYVEVSKGEDFLDGKCFISKIYDAEGLSEKIKLYCKEDSAGILKGNTYTLSIEPEAKLSINGAEAKMFKVGDILDTKTDGDKKEYIFLGYIGQKISSGEMFVIPVSSKTISTSEEFLRSSEFTLTKSLGGMYEAGTENIPKNLLVAIANFGTQIKSGVSVGEPIYEGKDGVNGKNSMLSTLSQIKNWVFDVDATSIKFIGLVGAYDSALGVNQETYDNASSDYRKVIDGYSAEVNPKTGDSLSEQALYNYIQLAATPQLGQQKTLLDLCEEFKRRFPSSKKIDELFYSDESVCNNRIKLSSSFVNSVDVLIDGKYRRITFEDIYQPDVEDYGAKLIVKNVAQDYAGTFEIGKDGIVRFSQNEYLKLKEVTDDYVTVEANVYEAKVGSNQINTKLSSSTAKIPLDDFKTFGFNNYRVDLDEVYLKKSAKVSVVPSIDKTGADANFTFKVGIEKRNIQLSPEKVKEQIAELNKSITQWNKTSVQLGTVVKGLNAACLATGTFMTMKNLVTNLGGKALARQDTMENYWKDFCTKELADKKYSSMEGCYFANADDIDKSVDEVYEYQQDQNEVFKTLETAAQTTGLLGLEKQVDSVKLKKDYAPKVKSNLVKNKDAITALFAEGEITRGLTVDNFFNNINLYVNENISLDKLRSLDLRATQMASGNAAVQQAGKSVFVEVVTSIDANKKAFVGVNEAVNIFGLPLHEVNLYSDKEAKQLPYSGATYKDLSAEMKAKLKDANFVDSDPVAVVVNTDGKQYLAKLVAAGKQKYVVKDLYDSDGKAVLSPLFNMYFIAYDSTSYRNTYKSSAGSDKVLLRYYETEPYAGMPAVVPFDLNNGWYAYIKQSVSVGSTIASYDDSARVSSFYLCNVGEGGIEEAMGGNDICQMINLATGQAYNQFAGLTEDEATKLVNTAVKSIKEAQDRYPASGYVKINGFDVYVGSPAADISETECTDFMSPKDCKILFNVCDPVVCPSSRCDFGGAYPVKDVAQTGIIGSLLLCLPNAKEGIAIPICVSGVKSGIDGFVSILTGHRDCLQENLASGKMIGVCDEIYSVYMCDLMWRQALPLAKLGLPKIMEVMFGQNVHGGGEYRGVQSAWETATKSFEYMSNYYSTESNRVFQSQSIEEFVGAEICKSSSSIVYPEMDVFDSLTEPNSPAQFHGRFDEITFTTATNPPISQYKVFYHIYAGQNRGAAYKVYLKSSSGGSYYQDTSAVKNVASGYIAIGEYAEETIDFTAASGYQELCINVNGQEECGFKQVSTSFAVNYIKDSYLAEQASATDITSEEDCVSGTASLYQILNPNIQSAAEDMIDPAIYNQGISRICATNSPGAGTDVNDGTEDARWVDVGYCDDEKMRCWLDTDSVEEAIKNADISQGVLDEVNNDTLSALMTSQGYLSQDKVVAEIDRIKELPFADQPEEITTLFGKTFWQQYKALLLLMRGDAYSSLIKGVSIEDVKSAITDATNVIEAEARAEATETTEGTGETTVEGGTTSTTRVKWTIDSALVKIETFPAAHNNFPLYYIYYSSYDDVKEFIDELYKDGLLSDDLYAEITGEGVFNLEENLDFVKDMLENLRESSAVSETTFNEGEYVTSLSTGSQNCGGSKIMGQKYQYLLGKRIMEIASSLKTSDVKFSDATVKQETGAKNFECLVLMQAMQEGCLSHCVFKEGETNELYCDGDKNSVLTGDDGNSVGVMQINTPSHPNVNALDFKSNVEYGVNYLSGLYNSGSKAYTCNGKTYSGWQRALRLYNGWSCNGGDTSYVENVLAKKSSIEELFPQCKPDFGESAASATQVWSTRRAKWTIDTALVQINTFYTQSHTPLSAIYYDTFTDVKTFIDELHTDGLLDDATYNDIVGGFFNKQENLAFVKQKLEAEKNS